MAYIQKREHPNGNVTYRARIRIQGMPDKSTTFASRTQAKIWGQKMEAEVRQGRYFPKQDDKERTFGEFIDRYLEKELPKKPKSLMKSESDICFIWFCHY